MKITILSDSVFIPTGYSNQAKLLANYLQKKGHQIHYLANSYAGATIDYAKLADGTEFNYKIYGELMHSYFMNTMSDHLKKTNSDIFLILLDTFMLFPNFLNIDLSPAKSIFWYPSDGGGGLPKGCDNILRKVNCPVAMARFGQKQVKDYYNIDAVHIPHGTEPDRFFKMSETEREENRIKWGFKDKFVIGVVARNQPRKMLDRTLKTMYKTMETFKKVSTQIPNAILFLHLDPMDPAQAFNMFSMMQKFGIENRVVFSGMCAHEGFGWDKMNEVYNLMDCFFLSTSGEGFGIPIIEAMSCEVPVIATDYTTTQELVKDNNAGFGVKLVGCPEVNYFEMNSLDYDKLMSNGTTTGSWEVERGLMDCDDAVNKIITLYNNPQLRNEMGKNGRIAVLNKYDFNKHVGPAFEKLMGDLCK